MTEVHLDSHFVYLVESNDDDTVLLALEPQYRFGHMCWFDTVRARAIPGTLEAGGEAQVTFRSTAGATYRFRPLTLETYRAQVQARVEGAPSFEDDAAMHRFYTRTL